MSDDRAQLEQILAEGTDAAAARERSAFDLIAGPSAKSIVLVGAGGLGRKTAAGLKRVGIVPLAFTDNNPSSWGTVVDGIAVLPPSAAAAEFGQRAVFVVAIFSPGPGRAFADFEKQFKDLGCERVSWFVPLFWKYPDLFLPHYLFDLPHKIFGETDAVREAYALWHDDASRREYVAQLRLRAFGSSENLPPLDTHAQYLMDDLFRLDAEDIFVDCGAYDGDTIKDLLAQPEGSVKTIVSLEPDPGNFQKLVEYRASLSRDLQEKIVLKPTAAWSRAETLYFEATGTGAAAITDRGTISVQAAPLDDLLDGLRPTYIKMDIEGAEPEALRGAANALAGTPILAVCVYHELAHLWRLPLQMRAVSDKYRFFLRSHNEQGLDTVCYAVPHSRLKATR